MEIWEEIPSTNGSYEVSNYGRVRSTHRKDARGWNIKGKILKPGLQKCYPCVSLCLNGTPKSYRVHRLVMLAFVGASNLEVDHINRDRSDNRLSNLEYVTHRENNVRSCKMDRKSDLPCGVYKSHNKFMARKFVSGVRHYLGMFTTKEEAQAAYLAFMNP